MHVCLFKGTDVCTCVPPRRLGVDVVHNLVTFATLWSQTSLQFPRLLSTISQSIECVLIKEVPCMLKRLYYYAYYKHFLPRPHPETCFSVNRTHQTELPWVCATGIGRLSVFCPCSPSLPHHRQPCLGVSRGYFHVLCTATREMFSALFFPKSVLFLSGSPKTLS